MSLPAIIPDAQVKRFRFFSEYSLYEGMTFEGHLYKLVRTYDSRGRNKAFEQACEWSNQGRVVISTDNSQSYSLWVDMRMAVEITPVMGLPGNASAA